MRRSLLLLSVAGAVALAGPTGADASCVPAVAWHGTTYVVAPPQLPVPTAGAPLRGGTVPACDDTSITAPDATTAQAQARPIKLSRARAIDPRIAVLAQGQLYISPACNDTLANTLPAPKRLPPRCGL